MDSMPIKIHLPPAAAIKSTSSSSRSKLALIWATQCTWASAAMMSRSSDLVRLILMAKLSSIKNTAIWPLLTAGPGLQHQQFVHHAFVGAKANGVAKETRDSAKFAAIRATTPGFHRNDAERSPAGAHLLQHALEKFGNNVELLQIDGVPGNRRIGLQRGFAFLAKGVDRSVGLLQSAANRVLYNARPSLVSFTKRHRIRVTRAAGTAQRFIGHFRDVRTAHDHGHADRADSIGHAIGLGDHASHRANAHQSDVLFFHKLRNTCFIHRLGVAIDQDYFVTGRRQRLQKEHPEMRHEVARNSVVRVI